MAYRRLPNTDKARVRALKTVLEKCKSNSYPQGPLKASFISEVNQILHQFDMAVGRYDHCYKNQIEQGRKVKDKSYKAKLYLSHFIQVLNLSIERDELSQDIRELYHLPLNNNQIPDLSTDKRMAEWGKKIIEGERVRTQGGGVPIYNPTIARVRVFYDLFAAEYREHQHMQELTARQNQIISSLRPEVDLFIKEMWNTIEEWIGNKVSFIEKMTIAKEYGIVYYSRNRDKK